MWVQAPPAIYDHQFHGQIHVYRHRMGAVDRYCLNTPVYGCAPIGGPVCDIHIISPEKDGVSKEFYARVLRHERAHCNGWPANHPA